MGEQVDVAIVGAGLAGLTCAKVLSEAGLKIALIEAEDEVGGRVRTDEHEGFLLDHGFQVLLTAYPTAKRHLDYEALSLCEFYPGAIVKFGEHSEKMADPFRRPIEGLKTLLSPIGSAGDKMRIGQLRARMIARSLESIYSGPGVASLQWLKEEGYSEEFITRFFKPFYGGVMLDRELKTSHKMLEFTYKMFADGATAVPERGMGQISQQLCDRLAPERVRTSSPVARLERQRSRRAVVLESGEAITADQLVLATGQDFAHEQIEGVEHRGWRGVRCVYFAAPEPPEEEAILVLNGEPGGVVNNWCVMSQVSAAYGNGAEALVSVAILGEGLKLGTEQVVEAARRELSTWYGASRVAEWRHLKTYDIAHGQPDQSDDKLDEVMRRIDFGPGVFVCGDHRETASIEGAMHSGERAAEGVLLERER